MLKSKNILLLLLLFSFLESSSIKIFNSKEGEIGSPNSFYKIEYNINTSNYDKDKKYYLLIKEDGTDKYQQLDEVKIKKSRKDENIGLIQGIYFKKKATNGHRICFFI